MPKLNKDMPKKTRPGEETVERFYVVLRCDADTGHRRYATMPDAMQAAMDMAEATQKPTYILTATACYKPAEPRVRIPLTAVDLTRVS